MDLDEEALRAFVVAAHQNGYAAADADTVEVGGGTRIEYEDGPWHYVDQYHGSRAYLGMEIVTRDDESVWGMHYHGAPTAEDVDHEPVYAFLRDALAATTPDDPYRGPDGLTDGEWAYHVDVDGTIRRFDGVETVTVAGECRYRGRFAGGLID